MTALGPRVVEGKKRTYSVQSELIGPSPVIGPPPGVTDIDTKIEMSARDIGTGEIVKQERFILHQGRENVELAHIFEMYESQAVDDFED